MALEMTLPELGENIDSATVVNILVAAGDKIAEHQTIVEVDTEKAAIEVPASASGVVQQIRVKQGDVVKVGQVLLTLEEAGKAAEPVAAPPPSTPSTPQDTPPPSASEQTGEPAEVTKPPEPEAKLETDPETELETEPEAGAASPGLRRMARELGVDINEVTGTGPGGRITEDNVRNYARSIILNARGPMGALSVNLPDFSRWGNIERKPMSGVRRKTAEHVQDAWSIPHVTHFDAADITELEQLRKSFAGKTEKAGGKLTMTAIALKVAAAALKVFPQCNASLDPFHGEIIYKNYYHVGVAVDTDRGLLVPVIRDVDRKNVLQLSIELTQIAEKARNAKLAIEDMQGGTFTITNLGGIGGSNFTPIINSPEVAILGISRASHQPVFKGGQFVPRLMLPLALSFDHRAIDGANAARFLRWIAEALEQPFMLAFEG